MACGAMGELHIEGREVKYPQGVREPPRISGHSRCCGPSFSPGHAKDGRKEGMEPGRGRWGRR
jgi:hypothetical protein